MEEFFREKLPSGAFLCNGCKPFSEKSGMEELKLRFWPRKVIKPTEISDITKNRFQSAYVISKNAWASNLRKLNFCLVSILFLAHVNFILYFQENKSLINTWSIGTHDWMTFFPRASSTNCNCCSARWISRLIFSWQLKITSTSWFSCASTLSWTKSIPSRFFVL